MATTSTSTYSPIEVAAWVVADADQRGELLTQMKLQKLVYYAQAWALALLDRPLFEEDFQAWMHGPVLPSLYREFKSYGDGAVPVPVELPDVDEEAQQLLNDVMDAYAGHTAAELRRLTHSEEPWRRARGDLPPEARCEEILPKGHLRTYYRQMYQQVDDE